MSRPTICDCDGCQHWRRGIAAPICATCETTTDGRPSNYSSVVLTFSATTTFPEEVGKRTCPYCGQRMEGAE